MVCHLIRKYGNDYCKSSSILQQSLKGISPCSKLTSLYIVLLEIAKEGRYLYPNPLMTLSVTPNGMRSANSP